MSSPLPSLAIRKCSLYYRTADSDEWTQLPGSNENPVRNVLFDGGLTFTQATIDALAKCRVKISVSGSPSIEISGADKIFASTVVGVEVVCDKVLDPIFTSTAKTDKGISDSLAKARTLPLTSLCKDFAAIRIVDVKWNFFKGSRVKSIRGSAPAAEVAMLKVQLETLLFSASLERLKYPNSRDPARTDHLRAQIENHRRCDAEHATVFAKLGFSGSKEARRRVFEEEVAKMRKLQAELAALEMMPIERGATDATEPDETGTRQAKGPYATPTESIEEQEHKMILVAVPSQGREGILEELKIINAEGKKLEDKAAELGLRKSHLLDQLEELDSDTEQ